MQFNFDASTAPAPSAPREYGPLPAGNYTMIISSTAIKATKAGTGEYLEAVCEVVEGAHAGRKHWERFSVSNPNKQAEDIARAALGDLCAALGLAVINDTDQLCDQMFVARMEIDRKDPTRNRIARYEKAGAAPAAPAAPAARPPARPAAPAARAAAPARPWQA
jgi:hypothetical protein